MVRQGRHGTTKKTKDMNCKVSYKNRTTLSAKECRSKKKSMFIV